MPRAVMITEPDSGYRVHRHLLGYRTERHGREIGEAAHDQHDARQ